MSGQKTRRLSLASPDISDRERELVLRVLDGHTLSIGPMVEQFEKDLAQRVGRKHAVAVSSGTAALHVIIRALGLGPGDAVITTPFSFVASANCLLYENAEPIFVDIEERTFNLDPDRVRKLLATDADIRRRTRAILAVDIFGHPADWDALAQIADEFGLQLIEDSAESLGSRYHGRPAGSFGTASIFAFYPNKQITTAEGGAVVTDDEEFAELCRSLRSHGRDVTNDWLTHVRLGFNYRLSELHSALGVAQLERIDRILDARAQVADWYAKYLEPLQFVHAPAVAPEVEVSWFVYVVRLDERIDRGRVISSADDRGIPLRPYFPAIHLMPHFRELCGSHEGDFPVTESVSSTTLALPFHTNMRECDIAYVCENLQAITEESLA